MRIPEEITKEHIKQAIALIDSEQSVPPHRASTGYDLRVNGKKYPPKYVVSRAYQIAHPGAKELRGFRGGPRTNSILASRGFDDIVPKPKRERRFWVVSPNVTASAKTIDLWKQAIKDHNAAFMGWGPNDENHPIGPKFAENIAKGDVMLIARRSHGHPDVVGFGVVAGRFRTSLRDFKVPDKKWHGSIRSLSPFISVAAGPPKLDIMSALNHTRSLCKLHPDRNPNHRAICDWMSARLHLSVESRRHGGGSFKPQPTSAVSLSRVLDPKQLDYKTRKPVDAGRARKREALLVVEYRDWLKKKKCDVWVASYQGLRCDVYEKKRNNLIEAKSSTRREYIRMAVGQLLDYSFLGANTFRSPHMAILLPQRPEPKILTWLDELKIKVIWKHRKGFVDNDGGQFT